ncbi:hypothetical protein B0H17DRAFT_1135554 [Mycena rosella]|uniref:Uncharacterized protein n=1 Tax=Mycena rosella TaxID=1033263 RepID=A0AAD7DD78_MYCRO|nr:hypothetical protein B0H17DRAFT_1135554 [Mycena rosella]
MGTTQIPLALPWEQLKIFEYLHGIADDFPVLWDFMPRFSRGAEVDLQLNFSALVSVPLALAHITSNLSQRFLHLSCRDPVRGEQNLEVIMQHVTFPHMFELCLFSGAESPPPQLAPPGVPLPNGTISEDDLLSVLSVLQALVFLSTFDDDIGTGPPLIVNGLLRRLIRTSDQQIVRCLTSLSLGTLLQFDEHTYLEFVVWRLKPTRLSFYLPFQNSLNTELAGTPPCSTSSLFGIPYIQTNEHSSTSAPPALLWPAPSTPPPSSAQPAIVD